MKDSKGNYMTYLFVETDSPSNITQKAAPIVLTLPIFKSGSNTEINNDVQFILRMSRQKQSQRI
nr:pilin N-terminal domain-containing protein [Weissella cibaria]